MVPPFLAYYAVATSDLDLLKESALQCQYYHDVLIQPSSTWMHIIGPEVQDYALWSTGNGWAAAGMSRVLATLKKSPLASKTKKEQSSLVSMIQQILDGTIALDTDNSGLLRNYLNDTTWWGEISGTSILAATALRAAKLEPKVFGKKYTNWAVEKMHQVDKRIDASEGENKGIVSPAINPLNWHDKTPYTSGSPEGQSFVVLLHAAYRDWKGK